MHATIRRYEGVDTARTNEVTAKVNETLVADLRKLPGFAGYYLIEAGDGVISSLSLFETAEQADESNKIVSTWITDENFASAIPNPPKITSGKVVAYSDGVTRSRLAGRGFAARAPARAGPPPSPEIGARDGLLAADWSEARFRASVRGRQIPGSHVRDSRSEPPDHVCTLCS